MKKERECIIEEITEALKGMAYIDLYKIRAYTRGLQKIAMER